MRYFICSNEDKTSIAVVKKIRDFISVNANFIYDEKNPEIVISVGGDGRFLKTIQKYLTQIQEIGIVGISTGSLGYLCDYKENELDEFLNDFISKTPKFDSRNLIEVYTGKKVNYYLNEFRVEKVFETLNCDVFINDHYFESFKGSGLNFASATGSTALNKSLGGPIISHQINCLILGEILPINNSISQTLNSFLVLNERDVVTLKGDFTNCSFGGDTENEIIRKNTCEKIIIRLSKIKMKLAHFKRFNFHKNLAESFIERR